MRTKGKRGRVAKQNSRSAAAPVMASKRDGILAGLTARMTAVIAAGVLCILAVATYANSIRNGFVWDDHEQVVMNASLREDAPFRELVTPNIWGPTRGGVRERSNYYRPLQMVTYWLTAEVFGFNATAFHAVNLAFHVVVVLLAFALFYTLTDRIGLAFASAALFAVHPIHSEAVDWISALPDIGCTAFVLLAFLCLVRARGEEGSQQPITLPRRRHVLLYAASFATFAVALFWKEAAIVFPVIVMAYVFCLNEEAPLARRIGKALRLSLPYWCILGLYFLLRFRILGYLVIHQRNWNLSRFDVGLTVLNLVWEYCWKLLAPVGLTAYYSFVPVQTLQDPRAIVAILFLLFAAGAILYGLRRARLASFAALWVFIALIPVLNVYAVGRNVFAERYLYLPSVGFCLLIVLLAARAGRTLSEGVRTAAGNAALAAVLIVLMAWTAGRNSVWKDDLTLFTRTLESSPNAPFVHNMVASLQPNDATGQTSAEGHYLKAISLSGNETPPDRLQLAIAGEGLASIYAARGEFDQALRALAQVRLANPNDTQVDGEEGLILSQAGRWVEAEAALRKAVAINPNDANVLNALGLIAWQHDGHLDEAAAYFSKALGVHPEADDFNASLHSNLGAVYGQQNRFSDALAQFQIAVQITPADPEYLTNLATALSAIGRIDDARRWLRTAIAAAPNYSPARIALEQIGPN
jgi:protein O-mannosyl-transferase